MDVNVFIREIVVHDASEPGGDAGEYDVAFAAGIPGDSSSARTSPRWTNRVRRAQTYEVLDWLGPVSVADGGTLVVSARGREHDLLRDDALLGGVAHLTAAQGLGVGKWWRTTNGKHFDFLFAVSRAEEGHAGRPVLSGRQGEIADAPGPAQPAPDDYFPGTD
ncbi:MAG TPA: hypothetical protein VFX49_11275 [Chloroflexota bacterium]|nr:hypothetical protein [Chloroflexota bacterium]